MAKGFGNLYYIRNIVYYKVSSYEQKALGANFWKDSFRNAFNEVKTHGVFILPPAAFFYLVVKWGEAERERMIRKDPKLYENDD